MTPNRYNDVNKSRQLCFRLARFVVEVRSAKETGQRKKEREGGCVLNDNVKRVATREKGASLDGRRHPRIFISTGSFAVPSLSHVATLERARGLVYTLNCSSDCSLFFFSFFSLFLLTVSRACILFHVNTVTRRVVGGGRLKGAGCVQMSISNSP